jgi:hypothetical protein
MAMMGRVLKFPCLHLSPEWWEKINTAACQRRKWIYQRISNFSACLAIFFLYWDAKKDD